MRSLAVPIAIGLLPALALACLLVSNWAAGGVPAETLQLDASIPVLVNMEPGQSLRVFGELQAHRSREGEQLGEVGLQRYQGGMLRTRYCGTDCMDNQRICVKGPDPDYMACKKLGEYCRNVACRRPDWEQKYGLCWAGARDNFEHCYASASASASFQKEQQMHCKDLFLNHVQSCA